MNGLLSPAPSPPSTSTSTVQGDVSTRKRTRSASDSSADSPSSPKRAVSEVPSASSDIEINYAGFQRANSLVQLTNDLGIDQYMASQDQAAGAGPSPATQKLLPHEKVAIINTLKQKDMVEGETWFVISHLWFRKWERACSGKADKDDTLIDESSLISIDNSDIADSDGNITVSPAEGINVDYVPTEAWEHFVQWYGSPKLALPRAVITQGILHEARLELFPLRLRLGVVVPPEVLTRNYNVPQRHLKMSKTSTVAQLVANSNKAQRVTSDLHTVRYWLVQGSNSVSGNGVFYTPSQLSQERGKLLDTSQPEKTLEEALIETGDILVFEQQVRNEWLVNETPQASRAVTPLFGSGSGHDFFAKLGGPSNKSGQAGRLSPKPPFTGMARSASPSKPPGLIGLVNLGNTCFMASALQCLKADPDLAEYFLTGAFRDELNLDNPLGMHGAVAESFGALLARLWVQNPSSSSYSPREFKQTIARFAPSFSGYAEQDSQEFLAFLLDGLHEDLNRILKKPYVEKPEWEGGGSRELLELAQKSWEGYMMRNDSVIVDLFQGQYKSTLICPECSKVSITFDPFMYLTLPLPITKKWEHTIYYVPWDQKKRHVQVPIELPHGSSFKAVKQLLGRWMETTPDNLLTLEVWSGRFYKNLADDTSIQEISPRDSVVCFELPCNAQQGIGFKRKPDDPFIFPVFHATQNALSSRPVYGSYRGSNNIFGNPFVTVINPKEANSLEAINEAVVERLSRWTCQDLYTWEGTLSPGDPEEHVITVNSAVETVTEIRETGEVVTVEETDITEMSPNDSPKLDEAQSSSPKRLGPKSDIFTLKLHAPMFRDKISETCDKGEPMENPITWKTRALDVKGQEEIEPSESRPSLLKPGDWLVCEWDVHMQAFYFGTELNQFENSRWRDFTEFLHPEHEASVRAREEQEKRNLTLEDCLDEFTKEEQLGEDDPWYCPSCKKHQRATKKFEIWKVPEVLVVHLKRFSSSRILRDKIDLLVDFPLEGLDLERRVGERQLAISMKTDGHEVAGLQDSDNPLVYDLFSVTEHRGGLGGGHYRAYAKNHVDENWYLFNDTLVSKTTAQAAVNDGAYLLFYKRRNSSTIATKTREKVHLARQKAAATIEPTQEKPGVSDQLPTPPLDSSPPAIPPREPQPLPLVPEDTFPSTLDQSCDFEELPDVPSTELYGSLGMLKSLNERFGAVSPASSNDAYAGSSTGQSGSLSPFSSPRQPIDMDILKYALDQPNRGNNPQEETNES